MSGYASSFRRAALDPYASWGGALPPWLQEFRAIAVAESRAGGFDAVVDVATKRFLTLRWSSRPGGPAVLLQKVYPEI
jgi:hypothetical protein